MKINELINRLTDLKENELDTNVRDTLNESLKVAVRFNKIISGYCDIVSLRTKELKGKIKPNFSVNEVEEGFSESLCEEIDDFCTNELREWLCDYFTEQSLDNKENER